MIRSMQTLRISSRVLGALLGAVLLVIASEGVRADTGKHFLWRVTSAKNTVYLLGSIHAMQPSDYPLSPVIQKAFKNTARLVLELNLTKMNPTKTRRMIFAKGLYGHGKTLQDALPPKMYQHATRMAKHLGLNLERFKTMKPWLASIVILRIELRKAGFSAADGVDMHFAELAARAHKQVMGLETTKYQMNLLASLPRSVQQKLLLQSLQQAAELNNEMGRMVKAWSNGEANQLATIMHQDFKGYPMVYQQLIIKRNHRWLPKVEKLIGRAKNYFVIVGSLHLVGEDGLIAQLRKAGYDVKQL